MKGKKSVLQCYLAALSAYIKQQFVQWITKFVCLPYA